MSETWVIGSGNVTVSPKMAHEILTARIANGRLEAWLISASGRKLGFLTNTDRARVTLLEATGAGEHAVDPAAQGTSDGFIRTNGHSETYPDQDTVPIAQAYAIVQHLLSHGTWPPGTQQAPDQ